MRSYIHFITVILFIIMLIPIQTFAEDKVEISVDYGFNGKVQMHKGFPMSITFKNNGENISGDLVIFSNPNYESLGSIVVPVELSKGDETTIHVSVPGNNGGNFNYNSQHDDTFIRLYEGSWEDGNEIPLDGNTKFRASFFPDNRLVVGVLSNSFDSLNFLNLSKFNGESVELLQVEQDELPEDEKGLELFDVLIINDYNLSNASTQSQNAIKKWIQSGGHLMIGSNPFLQQQLGELSELVLLHVDDKTSFKELSFLNDKESDVKSTFENVEFLTGTATDNTNVIYSENSLPIVLNKSYGLGEMTQFAFNIGNSSLTNTEVYQNWWSDVLRKTVNKNNSMGPTSYVQEDLVYLLGRIVDAFPSSFIPVNLLIVLFVVYLILLFPGLYFLLKKLDRREQSWFIIPVVAIVSSVAFFGVGAKDRISSSQINNVSILSIDDTGIASGYGAFSILTNSGGDYKLTVKPGEFNAFPRQTQNSNPSSAPFNYAMVENGQNQSTITFNDVEYWSIRSAYGDVNSIETGKINSKLRVEGQQLIGSLTSDLSIDLEEAYLLTGTEAYPLGKMEAGSTKDIQIDLKNINNNDWIGAPRSSVIASKVVPGYYNSNYHVNSGPTDKEELDEWKKYELLNLAMTKKVHQNDLDQPIIAGYTKDSYIDVNAEKKNTKIKTTTLITQPIEVETAPKGEFSFSDGSLIPELSIFENSNGFIHHNGLENGEEFIAIEDGKYQLTYQIPNQLNKENIHLQMLKFRYTRGNGTTYHLFNAETEEFISLEEFNGLVTFEENANEFLTKDGSIIIMFEKNGMNNPEIQIPSLDLEGEFTND
ncbi:hypothetical protein ACFSTA_13685 [Ornithinibacillus salinisoli]|uniref:DUF4350 domain-containing protein n=1 Tax=Ornithinibacillus salinisoli TaxID=1848459 RepID=A0ABW4W3U6_9BACI